jgi:CTP:molybdopterin cytidylyltransferase MocA
LSLGTPRQPIVVIPARLASTRLPNKPLADIHGEPMIVHVWRRAIEAAIGPVLVACGEAAIVAAVKAAGGEAVLTRPDHPSGSDRIFEALQKVDPDGRHDAVVNLQGDLPTVDPQAIRAVLAPLAEPAVDIGTIATLIASAEERDNPNMVKVAVAFPEPPVGLPTFALGASVGLPAEAAPRRGGAVGGPAPPTPPPRRWGARSISAACPCHRARDRTTIMSASTPFGAPHWRASSPCRRAGSSGASGWSNCARSKRACASMSPSLTPLPSVSILRPISRAPGRY